MNRPQRVVFVRQPATWYAYSLIGLQIYLFSVQGNVIPFLQSEFGLSYRVVSLHSSAMALGVVITGLFGGYVTRPLGRRWSLALGGAGIATGAILLCLSPGPWMSIPSCFLMGLLGAFIPSVVPATLALLHGEARREAFSEQAIFAYGFAIVGPLASGLFVAAGLGWRPAVLLGAALGFGLVIAFRKAPLPAGAAVTVRRQAALPPAFWAYWCVVAFSCAFEFSVLLWSPTFLERVIGLSAAGAATAASGFFIGALGGRIVLRALVQRLPARSILIAAFITGFLGFALYWGVDRPWAAIIGIFMLGLCVAPQYPLTMSLALGVAKGAHDAASARMTLAFGLAVLVAPALLGALADVVGLRYAHLTLPTLTAAGLSAFLIAGALARRLNRTA